VFWRHVDTPLEAIARNQQAILVWLTIINRRLRIMTVAFDRVIQEVTETRTKQASLIALVNGLAQLIRDNIGNEAGLNALADSMDQDQAEIQAAIDANADVTPAAPAPPPEP